jgi:predicted nucleic acid-binding protein
LPYADTDFFIALGNRNDRFHKSANDAYDKYKGTIWTSLTVVIELLIVGKRMNLSPERMVKDLLAIAKVSNYTSYTILRAVNYIEKENMSVFDSFHAALCGDMIISSDHTYDKLGIQRIKLLPSQT